MFDYLSIPPLRSLCGMWKRVVRVFSRELLLHKQVLTMRRRKETQPSTQMENGKKVAERARWKTKGARQPFSIFHSQAADDWREQREGKEMPVAA